MGGCWPVVAAGKKGGRATQTPFDGAVNVDKRCTGAGSSPRHYSFERFPSCILV